MPVLVEDAGHAGIKSVQLSNASGTTVQLYSYGATLNRWTVDDNQGRSVDILLGYESAQALATAFAHYLGSTVGRVANRIAVGSFSLDGNTYSLAINNGPNHNHGGIESWAHRDWTVASTDAATNAVVFTLESPDGDQGYPGSVKAQVAYALSERNELQVHFTASTDAATPVNMTQHAYFNLGGQGERNEQQLSEHAFKINADKYLPTDADCLTTGDIAPVESTRFDLRRAKVLQDDSKDVDNTYCLSLTNDRQMRHAATSGQVLQSCLAERVEHMSNGVQLDVHTDQPGIHLYTSAHLKDTTGKQGKTYQPYTAFCLETGGFPDAINKPQFPSYVLRPSETYSHRVTYAVSVQPPIE